MCNWLKKYFFIFKTSWQNNFVYRLNFVMWRLRNIIGLLTIYFLWSAVFKNQGIFGWQRPAILTYVFLAAVFNSFVFSSKTADLAGKINRGEISNFLLKPLSIFKYAFSLDISHKLLNTAFSLLEVLLLVFLLKPNLIWQTKIIYLVLTAFSLALSLIAYFLVDFLLGTIGFWTPEVWAPRFIFSIVLGFSAGSYFPLSFLPRPVYLFLKLTPFNYFIFFPLQLYLAKLTVAEIVQGFLVLTIWILLLAKLTKAVWQKGVKSYEAWGI